MAYRTERDSLGEIKVPLKAMYGSFTTRALKNFKISGQTVHPSFRSAIGYVKLAAAMTNQELGYLPAKQAVAIKKAAREFIDGKFDNQYTIDVFQAGAGTPYNMNSNEVIANRANQILGGKLGEYKYVHPNNHVNMAQSSNDVTPTASRIAVLLMMPELEKELTAAVRELEKKGRQYKEVLKAGRTHLQDAVPVTVGQEFDAYASALNRCLKDLEDARGALAELGIGGTATGTGINTDPRFKSMIVRNLSKVSGLKLKTTDNNIELTHSHMAFARYSSALRNIAGELMRITNDFRMLTMGPRAGLSEIILPEVEPGSSIMPGKVNPSSAECVNQVCLHIMGVDYVVYQGAQLGQLELNWYTPVIMYELTFGTMILTNTLEMFHREIVKDIKVDKKRCKELLNRSTCLATALAPYLGYDAVAKLVKEFIRDGVPMRDLVLKYGYMTKKEVDSVLSAAAMTKPRKIDKALVKKVRNRV